MNKRIMAGMLALFLMLTGCGGQAAPASDPEEGPSISAPEEEGPVPAPEEEGPSFLYQQKIEGESVLSPRWLDESLVCWIERSDESDCFTYRVHILDAAGAEEKTLYQWESDRKIESESDFDVQLSAEGLKLYLSDKPTGITRVTIDMDDPSVVEEESFEFPSRIAWFFKSKQDVMIGQEVFPERGMAFNWDIILFPLENQEQSYYLKQPNKTRYNFSYTSWSPSGEYFLLQNHDAYGMDRFEFSTADLRAVPISEWPKALQYDVFHQNGEFAFSFAVDHIYREDGSRTDYDFVWMPEDQIFLTSTFYDASLDSYSTKEQLIDASGTVVREWSYEGTYDYHPAYCFDAQGVYYEKREGDSLHLLYRSFLDDEVTDYGPVRDFAEEALPWLWPKPSPDGERILLIDHEQDLKILNRKG